MSEGDQIKRARLIRRLSQEQLGQAINKTKQYVSLLEKGKVKVSSTLREKISEVLKKPKTFFTNHDFKELVPEKQISQGQKIRIARIEAKMSQWDLAIAIGYRQGAISRYELDEVMPPQEALKKIAEATRKPLSYFFENTVFNTYKYLIQTDNLKYIPIYGDVAAGAPVERLDQLQVDSYLPLPEEIAKGKIIKGAFRVASDSMEPRILKGSYILIDNTKMVKDNDVALVHVRDKGTCIKQICFMPNNKIKLIPHNKKYQVSAYKLDDVSILGKVIGNVNYSF